MKNWIYPTALIAVLAGIFGYLWKTDQLSPPTEAQSPTPTRTVMLKCLNDGGMTVCQDSNGSLFRLVPTK